MVVKVVEVVVKRIIMVVRRICFASYHREGQAGDGGNEVACFFSEFSEEGNGSGGNSGGYSVNDGGRIFVFLADGQDGRLTIWLPDGFVWEPMTF